MSITITSRQKSKKMYIGVATTGDNKQKINGSYLFSNLLIKAAGEKGVPYLEMVEI